MLAEEFTARGYKAELLFLFAREGLSTPASVTSLTVFDAPPRSPKAWVSGLLTFYRLVSVREPRAIFGFQPLANILGALVSARTGCKFVGTQRNPSDSQSRITGWIEMLLGSSPLYKANIAVSNAVSDTYSHYPKPYRRKLQAVPNGTPRLISVDEDQAACRVRLSMEPGVPIVGCLGRLHDQKNPEFVIEIARAMDGVHFYFAGEGEMHGELLEAARSYGIEDRVHFLGRLSGADITRFYRAIDLLVFPSRYEGFGRVLVEAMSQGVPVIAHDMPVTREVAGDAATLLALDLDLWVKASRDLLANKASSQRSSERGILRASTFTVDAMVDGYLLAAGLPMTVKPSGFGASTPAAK